ncbi:hypothetical protein [Exiguobacterium qingdaonense]|uniref:hypothetical protein n=1 Tax=Exiguobacterium qingdaonense TaxID=2751251 RepID=UPI001BEA10D0|nr:hypothetical protein [Exiguobacterium qingdaonense]
MKKDRKVIPFPLLVEESELLAELKKLYEQAALARSTQWTNYIQEIASEGTWHLKDAELFRDLFIDWAVFFETDEDGMTPHGRYLTDHKDDMSPALYHALRGLAVPRCSIFEVTEDGQLKDWESKETYAVQLPEERETGDLVLGKLLDIRGSWRFGSAFLALPAKMSGNVADLYIDFTDEVGPGAFLEQFPEFCAELIDLLLDLEEGVIIPKPSK